MCSSSFDLLTLYCTMSLFHSGGGNWTTLQPDENRCTDRYISLTALDDILKNTYVIGYTKICSLIWVSPAQLSNSKHVPVQPQCVSIQQSLLIQGQKPSQSSHMTTRVNSEYGVGWEYFVCQANLTKLKPPVCLMQQSIHTLPIHCTPTNQELGPKRYANIFYR